MIPITWPELANIHPFAPMDQVEGYQEMFKVGGVLLLLLALLLLLLVLVLMMGLGDTRTCAQRVAICTAQMLSSESAK